MKNIIILLLISFTATAQRQNLVLEQTFDTSTGNWYENAMEKLYSATISDYTSRQGKSMKVELRKVDNYRAEFGTSPKQSTNEVWAGYSIFFPSTFIKDVSEECIQQWQAYPDAGEVWRSPPLMLAVLNDRFVLEIRTDTNSITKNFTFERIDLGVVTKSKWIDFVFHINWSYKNEGLIELWKNDKLVLSKNGANCYNDKLNPYFKCGIYKWDWGENNKSNTNYRIIYIDEVRIGNEKATYNDVYPSKKAVRVITYYNDGTTTIKQ